MSSQSIHLIDTNQSEYECVKNWFEVCQFNPTMVQIIGCELHAL